jgi:hypothetical protein
MKPPRLSLCCVIISASMMTLKQASVSAHATIGAYLSVEP